MTNRCGTKKKTMKATAEIRNEGLKSRAELLGTAEQRKGSAPLGAGSASLNPQLELELAKHTPPPRLKLAAQFRLHAGDFIRLENRICRVVRVSDCAAVVEVAQRPREFTTIFGKRVRIQPKPKLVRIASNSEVPILSGNGRNGKGGRK